MLNGTFRKLKIIYRENTNYIRTKEKIFTFGLTIVFIIMLTGCNRSETEKPTVTPSVGQSVKSIISNEPTPTTAIDIKKSSYISKEDFYSVAENKDDTYTLKLYDKDKNVVDEYTGFEATTY